MASAALGKEQDGGTKGLLSGSQVSPPKFARTALPELILSPAFAGGNKAAPNGGAEGGTMETILIVVVIVLLLGGGGWYGRGRWY
jgi:hypothetical protein